MDTPEATMSGRDVPRPSDSDDSSSDGGPDGPTPTQWLATTRQRRSTAGNRMKSMLANEEPDSDLELLFAEDENDQGFSDAHDDASDVQMDSSDDDDDDDDANPDDLAGEKELERRAKEQRLADRKRKARDAVPLKFRKKVRIDPTTPAAPPPRPEKKSERASWLPSPADLPTRSSSRKTTRISKEHLHQQMVEREARRLKQLALMQKKAAKLEALKKPPLSQADRLAEVALVEKRNSKSLNRWEEAEKQREEDRRARLAALNNRTLSGPVISFWSGVRQWKDALGQHVTLVEAKPKKKRERVDKGHKNAAAPGEQTNHEDDGAPSAKDAAPPPPKSEAGTDSRRAGKATGASAALGKQGQEGPMQESQIKPGTSGSASQLPSSAPKQEETGRLMAMPAPPPPPPPLSGGLAAPAPLSSSLNGLATPPDATSRPPDARPSSVLAAPVLAPPPGMDMSGGPRPTNAPKSGVLAPPDTSQHHPPPRPSEPPAAAAAAVGPSAEPAACHASHAAQPPPQANPSAAAPAGKSASPGEEAPQPPGPARGSTTTARNAIIFQSFDQNAIRDKTVQTQILFGRKMTKLSKLPPPAHCAITDLPARYRDPKTGLPYHNALAYREIQRLRKGDYRWSRLLGAWVGSGTIAARGVPDRFLCPESHEARRRRLQDRERPAQPPPPDSAAQHPAPPAREPGSPAAVAPPPAGAESVAATTQQPAP